MANASGTLKGPLIFQLELKNETRSHPYSLVHFNTMKIPCLKKGFFPHLTLDLLLVRFYINQDQVKTKRLCGQIVEIFL